LPISSGVASFWCTGVAGTLKDMLHYKTGRDSICVLGCRLASRKAASSERGTEK
jgi:hypothetical protein